MPPFVALILKPFDKKSTPPLPPILLSAAASFTYKTSVVKLIVSLVESSIHHHSPAPSIYLKTIQDGVKPVFTNGPLTFPFDSYVPNLLKPSTSAKQYATYVSELALTLCAVPIENTELVGAVSFQYVLSSVDPSASLKTK